VVLGELHAGHPGISQMKTLARMFLWCLFCSDLILSSGKSYSIVFHHFVEKTIDEFGN